MTAIHCSSKVPWTMRLGDDGMHHHPWWIVEDANGTFVLSLASDRKDMDIERLLQAVLIAVNFHDPLVQAMIQAESMLMPIVDQLDEETQLPAVARIQSLLSDLHTGDSLKPPTEGEPQ